MPDRNAPFTAARVMERPDVALRRGSHGTRRRSEPTAPDGVAPVRRQVLSMTDALAGLPPPWPADLLPDIREDVRSSRRKLVVLDDDPTGTQTVRDVVILTEWSVNVLARELAAPAPVFFVLTNSRSLPPTAAATLIREIAGNLLRAAERVDREFSVVNRGDSTLRGHFPIELEVLADALEMRSVPWLLAPFFEAGGRLTMDDVHYIAEGGLLVPAAQTSFAQDATFGYHSSNLRQWVEEKTAGRVSAGNVASLSIELLRVGGPIAVQRFLAKLGPGSVCVVNAAVRRDLEVFVLGLLRAEAAGERFLCRTAASFVAARAGRVPPRLMSVKALRALGSTGGLAIVGSHVPKTTEQLQLVLAKSRFASVELHVAKLRSPGLRRKEIARVRLVVNTALAAGRDTVLYTSRLLARGTSRTDHLRVAMSVSDALTAVVSRLTVRPRFVIAKGGITSSEIATKALRVGRAVVAGQILPGVPVWRLGDESRWPGLPYVVFPGNVGGRDALLAALAKLAPIAAALPASDARGLARR